MRTLALIPARAGSKGVPHKNTREFRGLPLLAHAIKVGQATCHQTVVSTEDMETACIAAAYGAPVIMRPPELAQDWTPMLPVVQHALANVVDEPGVVVLLQPSSPSLKRAERVNEALELMKATWADSIASVVKIPAHQSPDYACFIEGFGLRLFSHPKVMMDEGLAKRQDCRPAYYRDGTVYVMRRRTLKTDLYGTYCVPLHIPANESVTIDTEEDWTRAEALHG